MTTITIQVRFKDDRDATHAAFALRHYLFDTYNDDDSLEAIIINEKERTTYGIRPPNLLRIT